MNEYTAIAGVARSHDDNGNLLVDGERVMSFDYKNRLVAVTDAATGNPVAEYRYYADNRRAEKRVFSETAPGVLDDATAFFWDGWRCCEEQDVGTGETETTYVWSPVYVDELVQFERTAAHELGAGRFWVHQDARADVVAITDAAGSVVERRFYDDFGRLLDAQKEPTTESVTGLEYGFQGRRLDAETGLVYFRNRYYDPGTGRFVQRDPVWDASNVGGWYTFVGNGPWGGLDPLGLGPNDDESIGRDELREALDKYASDNSGKSTEELVDELSQSMKDGGYNLYGGRYIYTEDGGWIDLLHFFEAASYALGPCNEVITNVLGWLNECAQCLSLDPSGHPLGGNEDLTSNAAWCRLR